MTHAYNQAKAQLEHIQELMAAYHMDWGRYHEVREEWDDILTDIRTTRESLDSADTEDEFCELNMEMMNLQADAEELQAEIAEFDAARQDCEDSDEVMELIMEHPLSIEVRSGWVSTSDFSEAEPEEFCILLCTGGPAVRIMGELDADGDPCRAWLEYSDWDTPWTSLNTSGSDVLEFAQMFTYVY